MFGIGFIGCSFFRLWTEKRWIKGVPGIVTGSDIDIYVDNGFFSVTFLKGKKDSSVKEPKSKDGKKLGKKGKKGKKGLRK